MLNNKCTLLGCWLLFYIADDAISQTQKNPPIFDARYQAYRRWGIHFNNGWYAPAYAKKQYGVYDIDTKPMRGITLGFTYTFRSERQLSYYAGLDMEFLPYNYFYFNVPYRELPDNAPNYVFGSEYSKSVNDLNVLSIPFGVSWKVPLNKAYGSIMNAVLSLGMRIHFLQDGDFSFSYINGIGNPLFLYWNGKTRTINNLTPTFNVSAGVDWFTSFAIINVNLNFQKGIVPFFQGEYGFTNLMQSPDTKGVYKVRADYLGLDVGLTFKKSKKKMRAQGLIN